MRTMFISQELWELVETGYDDSDDEKKLKDNRKRDAKALFFLQQAVSEEIFSGISAAKTSKEAWQILKTEFQGCSEVLQLTVYIYMFTLNEMRISLSLN